MDHGASARCLAILKMRTATVCICSLSFLAKQTRCRLEAKHPVHGLFVKALSRLCVLSVTFTFMFISAACELMRPEMVDSSTLPEPDTCRRTFSPLLGVTLAVGLVKSAAGLTSTGVASCCASLPSGVGPLLWNRASSGSESHHQEQSRRARA